MGPVRLASRSFSTFFANFSREGPEKGGAALKSSKSAGTRRVGVLVMPSGAVLAGGGGARGPVGRERRLLLSWAKAVLQAGSGKRGGWSREEEEEEEEFFSHCM
jgi:hypothetical protein